MLLDTLSRWSFGITISLHYIFPLLTMGGCFWFFIQSLGRAPWSMLRRSVPPLVLFTALGITTGYVLKWHFEKIWTPYYELIGDVFYPLLGLEAPISLAGFALFYILLFRAFKNEDRRLLNLATGGLFFSTLISASVITAVNSWMQFPSGVRIISNPLGNIIERFNLWEVVMSPTFPIRFAHVLLGALVLGGAWQMFNTRRFNSRAAVFLWLIWMIQFYVGHHHAGEVYAYQPEKFAAFEGHEEVYGPADLFLLPTKDHRVSIKLKGMTSFMMYNDGNQPMYGLDAWQEHYLTDLLDTVFASYHVMVLIHFLLFGVFVYLWRKREGSWPSQAWALVVTIAAATVANYAGWYTTEMGRQPWIVRGIMTTQDASSPARLDTIYLGVALSLTAFFSPIVLWRIFGIKRRIKALLGC